MAWSGQPTPPPGYGRVYVELPTQSAEASRGDAKRSAGILASAVQSGSSLNALSFDPNHGQASIAVCEVNSSDPRAPGYEDLWDQWFS